MKFTGQKKALYYSLDEKLWIKKLRSGDIENIPDTKKLENWMQEKNIKRQIADIDWYHFKFHRISSKPYIIYYQWNIELLNSSILAIVGPRKVSNYASSVMEDIFVSIKKYDIVTISGGAPWVDTICHELSLKNNIPTIMVLWWGLGYYFQRQEHHLIKKVVDNGGLVISEFKLKKSPTNYTFPQRNRIVAGLSDMVFVPAAWKKSWSLITVDFALQAHTSVYTVPASIYEETSAGSNAYLAEGKIKAVVNFTALFDVYFEKKDIHKKQKSFSISLSPEEERIIQYLREYPEATIENIWKWLSLELSFVMSQMTLLEMQSIVYEKTPGVYTVK